MVDTNLYKGGYGLIRTGRIGTIGGGNSPGCILNPVRAAGAGIAGWREAFMARRKKSLSPKYQVWVDARKRFGLSHAHVQMARELGMNPGRLGSKANHKQEPWKLPLPEFIEKLYFKRFGTARPDNVRSIEQMVKDKKQKQAERKARKQAARDRQPPDSGDSNSPS